MYKFKDCKPEDTLLRIKYSLLNNGITTYENWYNDVDGLFSVTIFIEKTSFFANGKGTSRLFALASGYSELMERIQNRAFFRFNTNILDNDINIEKKHKYSLNHIKNWIKLIKDNTSIDFNNNDIETLKELYSSSQDIICSEYKGLNCEETIILPNKMVDIIYGTNGMVAGNTEDEAIVQGLSEVLERYVIKEIIKNGITPPNLDENIICNIPNLKNNINIIESTGRYKIILKDLSINKKIPSVGLILFDVINNKYFVKVGVHPVIEIAVERCLTELMQGKNLKSYQGMTEIGYKKSDVLNTNNIIGIFVDGHGMYPYELFIDNSSYEASLTSRNFSSNKEMKEYLINLCNNLGFKIFINDVSSSVINAYHIIVPGISELMEINDTNYINRILDFRKLNYYILNIKNLSKQQIQNTLHILETYNVKNTLSIDKLLIYLNLKRGNFYSQITVQQLKFMLYMSINNFQKSLENIKKYNDSIDNKNNSLKYQYYKCIEFFIELKLNNYNPIKINSILYKFFNKKLVKEVMEDLKNDTFEYFPNIYCNDKYTNQTCEKCDLKSICYLENELTLYNKVKNIK